MKKLKEAKEHQELLRQQIEEKRQKDEIEKKWELYEPVPESSNVIMIGHNKGGISPTELNRLRARDTNACLDLLIRQKKEKEAREREFDILEANKYSADLIEE